MKPHKHSELIKAWADGAEIEYFSPTAEKWVEVGISPAWSNNFEYRIKPESKPDVVWDLYCRIYMKDNGNGTYEFIKAEKLKSAEVLK